MKMREKSPKVQAAVSYTYVSQWQGHNVVGFLCQRPKNEGRFTCRHKNAMLHLVMF